MELTKRGLARSRGGFTLIELLIVMAVLGVLAVVILLAINPVQQLARTRDSGRKSTVTQIGHSLEAYFTARGGTYLTSTNCTGVATAWLGCLQTAGEISTVPSSIAYSVTGTAACTITGAGTRGIQNNLCYSVNATGDQAIVYVTLESSAERTKCATGTAGYFVWSTADGRGGLICLASGEPSPGTQTWNATQ
ncbi:type II secretion system protein [Candidatus Woesebacteria bacterium]|nr:type II secretion system protein [Candidatus Woesebacteria bacterium]